MYNVTLFIIVLDHLLVHSYYGKLRELLLRSRLEREKIKHDTMLILSNSFGVGEVFADSCYFFLLTLCFNKMDVF